MGRVFKPKYAWTKKDGTHVEKITKAWYIEYTDASGRWVRRKAGTTKEQAADALRKAETDVLSIKNGLPVERPSEILMRDLVKRYLADLRPHAVPRHLTATQRRLETMLKDLKAIRLADLSPERVNGFLNRLERNRLAPKTINHYLASLKALLNWAVELQILPYNPLGCVRKRSEAVKHRVRRALSEQELVRHFAAAHAGPFRRLTRAYKGSDIPPDLQAKLTDDGIRNALIYRILAFTGLRINEARSLRWSDLDLEAGTLTTRPTWEGNKSGRQEMVPLAPGLIEALSDWKARHTPKPGGIVVPISKTFLRIMNDDLVAAGLARRVPLDKEGEEIPLDEHNRPLTRPNRWIIDKRDAAGRVLDLHALRHTFGTRLIAAGADIKTVQTLMRHSSPELTLGVYLHSDKSRMKAAVAALPDLAAARVAPATAQAAKGA